MTPSTPGWLVPQEAVGSTRIRLFCFPSAGSGTALFNSWRKRLPPEIGLFLVQLPGRERRLMEPPHTSLEPLTEALSLALRPAQSDLPFAFFGHSMGARIAFELARNLRRNGLGLPARLFVSGCHAPHLPERNPPLHRLPDPDLIRHLGRFGGTPRELLDNDELMSLVLPTLRADLTLCETYTFVDEPPLACPIAAYGGTEDPLVSSNEIAAWSAQTTADFDMRMLPGAHFFVQSARDEILRDIVAKSLGERPLAAVPGWA